MAKTIFITTTMRCGSTWLCDLTSGLVDKKWVFWKNGGGIKAPRFVKFAKENKGIAVVKMHYTRPSLICEAIEDIEGAYVLTVLRDIKDVAVSMIFYLRYDRAVQGIKNDSNSANITEIRKHFNVRNKALNDKNYVNAFIQEGHFNQFTHNWRKYDASYKHPKYWHTTYGALSTRPVKVLQRLNNFVGMKKNDGQLQKIIQQSSFKSKTGRDTGKGDTKAFRRKGIPGDHKNWLDPESVAILSELATND